jgi:hypothetical protein
MTAVIFAALRSLARVLLTHYRAVGRGYPLKTCLATVIADMARGHPA